MKYVFIALLIAFFKIGSENVRSQTGGTPPLVLVVGLLTLPIVWMPVYAVSMFTKIISKPL